jgi:hypothetical protein
MLSDPRSGYETVARTAARLMSDPARAWRDRSQYWSELMTSPMLRVERACHTPRRAY